MSGLVRLKTGPLWIMAVVLLPAIFAVDRPALAQSASAAFDSAAGCYERGDYEAAIEQYSLLLQQGYDDPRIWYNLGNAQFKAGQLGRSIKAYLRARRRTPRDPDIEANLQFVRLFAADKLEKSGRLFILGWADDLSARYTLSEWLATAGVFFLLLTTLTAFRVWSRRGGRAAWYWLVLGGFLWLLMTGGASRRYHDEYLNERGVVVVAETDIRGGPGNEYTLQFTGHDGLLFTIDRREAGWYLVAFENGVKGWVIAEAIERI